MDYAFAFISLRVLLKAEPIRCGFRLFLYESTFNVIVVVA